MDDYRPVDTWMLEAILKRRSDHEFMDRLRQRIQEDALLLSRIEEHRHRYPQPNQAGFPTNQCLDCGGWIIAQPDLTPPGEPNE